MVGYNLYYIPRERDWNTGEEWDGDAIFLHLSYGSQREAQEALKTLETLYGEGRIQIDVRAGINTYCPGEGA